MEIDWNKTWAWSTDATGVEALIRLINQITLHTVSKQRQVKDLGCPTVYHGTNVLDSLKHSLWEAKQRLLRVQWSSRPLEVKIHVIAASIYPLSIYGCELTIIGLAHLESLRAQIAQALIGEKAPSASSALFLQFADTRILDPKIFAILMALKTSATLLIWGGAVIL